MLTAVVRAACALCACFAAQALAQRTVVIRDVTVIDPRSGSVQTHRTVVVEGRQIRSVDPGTSPVSRSARVISGKGKFLIPGLWDAHVHLTKTGELSLPLFVANGVTGVRDMGSDTGQVLKWRREIEAGSRIGPRIKTSGQILESRANIERMKREGTVEPVDRIRIGVANPAEAIAAVDRLAAAGVDHIKMRTTPELETFQAAAEEARRRNLPFTAHPVGDPEQLLRAGLRSVEHFLTYPPLNSLPEAERRNLFRRMRDAGLYLSNTMVNLEGLLSIPYAQGKKLVEDDTGQLDPRRKYVCGYLIEDWREQLEEVKDAEYEPLRKGLPDLFRDFREMWEEGVPVLAGTDAGVLLTYPGFSLHDELEALVRHLRLTPLEVLRIATDGIAGFYREKDIFGAIQAGQIADLVLLDADPLADIRNTKRIAGVMIQGRWLDRKELDRILNTVERSARSGCEAKSLIRAN